MTDRAQFEAMLEALINEDQETAKEIFHNIVVGKSREIYQELLAEDFEQDKGNPYSKQEEEEEEEESVGDEEDKDADDSEENPFGGDDSEEEDDSEEDGEEGEEDGEEGDDAEFDGEEGEGDIEDRVMDLEDALEDLKAEFEQLLQGEEHEEEQEPGIHGEGEPMHDLGADIGGGEHDELDDLMEYVIKVADPKHGDNGANTKSSVAGKNDMGGTTSNIAQNFSTTSGGTEGGLASTKTKPQDAGNVNVPGAKSATKLKSVAQGHGAEKAGKKETADNKKSAIGGKIR